MRLAQPIAVLIAVMLLVTACGSDDGGTASTPAVSASAAASAEPTPTASPEASAAPTDEPEATPSPRSTAGTDEPTVVLEPDSLAEVIIT